MTIAERAIEEVKLRGLKAKNRKKLNSFEQNDEIWAVFDRDNHPNFKRLWRNAIRLESVWRARILALRSG